MGAGAGCSCWLLAGGKGWEREGGWCWMLARGAAGGRPLRKRLRHSGGGRNPVRSNLDARRMEREGADCGERGAEPGRWRTRTLTLPSPGGRGVGALGADAGCSRGPLPGGDPCVSPAVIPAEAGIQSGGTWTRAGWSERGRTVGRGVAEPGRFRTRTLTLPSPGGRGWEQMGAEAGCSCGPLPGGEGADCGERVGALGG